VRTRGGQPQTAPLASVVLPTRMESPGRYRPPATPRMLLAPVAACRGHAAGATWSALPSRLSLRPGTCACLVTDGGLTPCCRRHARASRLPLDAILRLYIPSYLPWFACHGLGHSRFFPRQRCRCLGGWERLRRRSLSIFITSHAGFAKPVGTGPVRSVPGGTGPARYTNRSGSHPKNVPINSQAR
jgi:hypothetical protein